MKTSLSLLFIFISISFICCNDNSTSPENINKAGFCLTFDDTYINDWNSIIPILDSNNVKATFFLTQLYKVSENEIILLRKFKEKGHEIGCHGWHHLNAMDFLENNLLTDYINKEISPAINFMDSCGFHPTAFSYPYGYNCDSLDKSLLKSFSLLRDVTDEQRKPLEKNIEDIEEIYYKFDDEKVISSLGIDANFNISLDMIEAGFKRVVEKNEVIVFYSHCPIKKCNSTYQIEYQYLRDVFKLAEKYKLKSYTFTELTK